MPDAGSAERMRVVASEAGWLARESVDGGWDFRRVDNDTLHAIWGDLESAPMRQVLLNYNERNGLDSRA